MKNLIFLLSFFFLFNSCKKKTIQLPQVAVPGISDIYNHSQIWVFYKQDKDEIKAEINKNNTISTTHWIINIDKRLTLSSVVPALNMIKAKRAKKSVHSAEGMNNYLTYSNIQDNKIAMFSMDGIQYMMLPKSEIHEIINKESCKHTIEFDQNFIHIDGEKIQTKDWDKPKLESITDGCLQLIFNENITYQQYMEYRLQISSVLSDKVQIETVEFIII